MIRFNVTILVVILAVSFSTPYAATYSWTDEQGTIHFTEDLGTVPEKLRNKALKTEETEPAPKEKPASQAPVAPEATLQAAPPGGDGDKVTYDGKTYDQWQTELAEREAEMVAVRKRIDEVAALFRNPATKKEERDKLLAEHKSLSVQFSGMKSRYFQLVESARKAGLTVNIQQ